MSQEWEVEASAAGPSTRSSCQRAGPRRTHEDPHAGHSMCPRRCQAQGRPLVRPGGEGGTEKTARKAKWGMKGTAWLLSDSSLGSVKPAVPLLPHCLL